MKSLSMLRRLWTHRDLVLSLVRRHYQLRYRQSMVGFVWAIVPPLITVAAATIVFHRVAKVDPPGDTPYPLFAFAALTPWSFFASSLTYGVSSVIQGQTMITRLVFPRAALPLSMLGLALVDLSIASVTFVGFVYVTGAGLPITALWFPTLLAIELVLAAGVVLLGSALNVFTRDIKLAVPLLAQLWLFLTPVMYPLSEVPPNLQRWYTMNPMTGVIESFRRILIDGHPPDIGTLVPAIVGSLAFFLVGVWYFAATESRFADVV